jgi:hypothetical protein
MPRCYEGVPKSFRTGRLERELQMVQLSATRYNCIAILWVSLVSFVAITRVASQRVFIAVVLVLVDFIMDSVRKLLDTASYMTASLIITPPYCNVAPFIWRVWIRTSEQGLESVSETSRSWSTAVVDQNRRHWGDMACLTTLFHAPYKTRLLPCCVSNSCRDPFIFEDPKGFHSQTYFRKYILNIRVPFHD